MMAATTTLAGMPNLGRLVEGFVELADADDRQISAVCIDSRRVTPGDLFIALSGTRTSGANFIHEAVSNGAAAVLVDASHTVQPGLYPVPVCSVPDLQFRTGLIADRFYNSPSSELNVTGITGTNGKTSVANYLAQAFSDNGSIDVGTIGTLGHGIFGGPLSGENTTPDAVTIHGLLARCRDGQIRDVVMEVSSHALEQGRVSGVSFKTAVFTNLSRDHLDYHRDLYSYARAKKKLFSSEGLQYSVINYDDKTGRELVKDLQGQHEVISYGLVKNLTPKDQPVPSIRAVILHENIDSLTLEISSPWGQGVVGVNLPGIFNAYNILAVLGVQGIAFDEVLRRLSRLRSVPGRMELFRREGSARIFIDYAHTPDSLEQTLAFLRRQCSGKLVGVFGCGGDRDRGKRPEMGEVAGRYCDHLILTNDNPRQESPNQIIRDIVSGLGRPVSYEIQPDRRVAISQAISMSGLDDVILVAGKGHEVWQEIGAEKFPFSDRETVSRLLEERA